MIVDANKLVDAVDDVQLATIGDLLSLDRAAGLQGGLDEFERRYPSQFEKFVSHTNRGADRQTADYGGAILI